MFLLVCVELRLDGLCTQVSCRLLRAPIAGKKLCGISLPWCLFTFSGCIYSSVHFVMSKIRACHFGECPWRLHDCCHITLKLLAHTNTASLQCHHAPKVYYVVQTLLLNCYLSPFWIGSLHYCTSTSEDRQHILNIKCSTVLYSKKKRRLFCNYNTGPTTIVLVLTCPTSHACDTLHSPCASTHCGQGEAAAMTATSSTQFEAEPLPWWRCSSPSCSSPPLDPGPCSRMCSAVDTQWRPQHGANHLQQPAQRLRRDTPTRNTEHTHRTQNTQNTHT
jgi:hypothetical protein